MLEFDSKVITVNERKHANVTSEIQLMIIHFGYVVFLRSASLSLSPLTLISLKPVASNLGPCDN